MISQKGVALLAVWLAIAAIDVYAIRGVMRLEIGDGFDRVFKGGGARFDDYVHYIENYGSSDGLQIVVEGDDLADPAALSALIDFVLDVQLFDGVVAVLSPFSVPIPSPEQGIVTLDLLPNTGPDIWQSAFENQPALARMLTQDRRKALITVFATQVSVVVAQIDALAADRFNNTGLRHQLTGLPVALGVAQTNLLKDFVRLSVIGAALGTVVAVIALNGWWVALIAMLSCATAVLWGIGTLGWMGAQINVISIALPILVLALALSDAIHLAIEQRARLLAPATRPIRDTLIRIGPAVMLTSITTAIAFLSLRLSRSDLISEMGTSGAMAVMAAGLGVLVASTALGGTALHLIGQERMAGGATHTTRRFFNWFWLPRFGLYADRPIAAVGLVLTGVACIAYVLAEPRFSLYENLRESDPVMQTLHLIETEFGPSAALQIPLALEGGDPVTLARAASQSVQNVAPGLTTLSIADLGDVAQNSGAELSTLLAQMPDRLRNRLDGQKADQTIITVPFAAQTAKETRALSKMIEAEFAATPNLTTGSGRVTGAEVMTAFVSSDMIRALSLSLLLSIGAVGLFIAIWLKSVKAGVLALAANVLPVALVGAILGVSGQGVSFAAGIALTLAFGIAVDDTIHVMNRVRLGRAAGPQRLEHALQDVTPPVVVTSLVLVAGLLGTSGALLPKVEEFGALAMSVFLLALISDLVFLPALLKRFRL